MKIQNSNITYLFLAEMKEINSKNKEVPKMTGR